MPHRPIRPTSSARPSSSRPRVPPTRSRSRAGTEPLLLPVIVREIESTAGRDADLALRLSRAPRSLPDPAPDPARSTGRDTGLVSLFVRDRIGDAPALPAGPCAPRSTSPTPGARAACASACVSRSGATSDAAGAWRPSRAPMPSRPTAPPSSAPMPRRWPATGASARYLYPREYFERLLAAEPAWLLLAGAGERGARRRRDRGAQRRLSALLPGRHRATPPSRTRR